MKTFKNTIVTQLLIHPKNVNCTPWDYPFPRSLQGPYPLCTSYHDGMQYFNSLHEFNDAMEDPEITDACSKECLPNCGEITYSYEMDTTDLEVEQLCQRSLEDEHSLDTRDVSNYTYMYMLRSRSTSRWDPLPL